MTAAKPPVSWEATVPLFSFPVFETDNWANIKLNGDIDDNARAPIEAVVMEFKTYTSAFEGKPSPSASERQLQVLRNKAKDFYEAFRAAGDVVKGPLLEALDINDQDMAVRASHAAYEQKKQDILQLRIWLDKTTIEETPIKKDPTAKNSTSLLHPSMTFSKSSLPDTSRALPNQPTN